MLKDDQDESEVLSWLSFLILEILVLKRPNLRLMLSEPQIIMMGMMAQIEPWSLNQDGQDVEG